MNQNDKHEIEQVELELEKLQPQPLSSDFVERLAERLDALENAPVQPSNPLFHRALNGWRVAAGLAAALLISLGLLWSIPGVGESPVANNDPPAEVTTSSNQGQVGLSPSAFAAAGGAGQTPLPTVGSYAMAMRQSSSALDSLFQRHARSLLPPTRELPLQP